MTSATFPEVTYETIVGRSPKPVIFSGNEVAALQGKRILVTGAGGSIGSRLVKLISTLPEVTFLATDRDESALHSLSLELSSSALFDSPNLALMDIKDLQGIEQTLEEFKPDVVIHAAALKHLSALEKQPREALTTNVQGTSNLAQVAYRLEVPYFVNISTDKAASPTSTLGKSKRLAELLIADYRNNYGMSKWTSCRFGNVFASRGSVIETFISQIKHNAPITLTHEKVSRFFMHRDEAAFLTIKSLLVNGGDVHIFDMGDPVYIYKIITNLVLLFESTSPILITGLRPGEKLDEDLLSRNEIVQSKTVDGINIANIEPTLHEIALLSDLSEGTTNNLLRYLSNT